MRQRLLVWDGQTSPGKRGRVAASMLLAWIDARSASWSEWPTLDGRNWQRRGRAVVSACRSSHRDRRWVRRRCRRGADVTISAASTTTPAPMTTTSWWETNAGTAGSRQGTGILGGAGRREGGAGDLARGVNREEI